VLSLAEQFCLFSKILNIMVVLSLCFDLEEFNEFVCNYYPYYSPSRYFQVKRTSLPIEMYSESKFPSMQNCKFRKIENILAPVKFFRAFYFHLCTERFLSVVHREMSPLFGGGGAYSPNVTFPSKEQFKF